MKMIAGLFGAAIVIVAIALAVNSGMSFSQKNEEAVIWIGRDRLPSKYQAQPFARELLPYALLAAKAYEDENGVAPNDKPALKKLVADAHSWLVGWRHLDRLPAPGTCKPDGGWCISLEGLGVRIWLHQQPGAALCDEAVIAFRGTDFNSSEDWLANIRWFTRLLPVRDQYDQVYDLMPQFMTRLKDEPCFGEATRVVTTGHSLGGGLAQLAAYTDGHVSRVYAFDPSSVTGFYMVPSVTRDCTKLGLKIDRIYERNEVLAYLRFVMKLLYTVDHQDPQIRSVRFNVSTGASAVSQHSIVTLGQELLKWAGNPNDTAATVALPDWTPPAEAARPTSAPRDQKICPQG
jgi:pimeloyl-ACP methyl ester carboxylesterase